MKRETQISAVVSRTTSDLLERHVRATGVKKGHLVEQALRHHLQALQELPADVVVRALRAPDNRASKWRGTMDAWGASRMPSQTPSPSIRDMDFSQSSPSKADRTRDLLRHLCFFRPALSAPPWAPPQESVEKGGFHRRPSRRIHPIHPQPAHRYRQRRTIGSKTASSRRGARLKRLAPQSGQLCTCIMFTQH
jgi:hypothetical protein